MILTERKSVVFLGHVDHGKSTLIGRILFDQNLIDQNKIAIVSQVSKEKGKSFEFAYLLDALQEEQEKNITIDIARCFAKIDGTEYLFLDAPGHIEFLKNMLSGATRADLAVLLIDAKEGLTQSTYCHLLALSFLNFKNIIVCINKMDLIEFNQEKFFNLKEEFTELTKNLNLKISTFVPISAYQSENVISKSIKMPWYGGPSFIDILQSYKVVEEIEIERFKLFVQDVYLETINNQEIKSIVGKINSGFLQEADLVRVWPRGEILKVVKLKNSNGEHLAKSGDSISIVLDKDIKVCRGHILTRADQKSLELTYSFTSKLLWLSEVDLTINQKCLIRIGTLEFSACLIEILDIVDLKTQNRTDKLALKEFQMADCVFNLEEAQYLEPLEKGEYVNFVVKLDKRISGAGIIKA